jgi:DNA-nicking Smr family endonuclease
MSRKPTEVPDHALWEEVKRSIKPLGLKSTRRAASRLGKPAEITTTQHIITYVAEQMVRRRPVNESPPPLAQMDRRTAQRLSRGQIDPEARLDLHGEGVETARIKLLHFLSAERHQGSRIVLVISGKGASPYARHTLHGTSHFHAPEREGRLRREVPLWLHEESFRLHVVGFQPAHPKHGGGGAFYVRLRKTGHHT